MDADVKAFMISEILEAINNDDRVLRFVYVFTRGIPKREESAE